MNNTALDLARDSKNNALIAILEPITHKRQGAAGYLGKAAFAGEFSVLDHLLKTVPINALDIEPYCRQCVAVK